MNRELYKVTKEHKASSQKAMILNKGDKVKVSREDPEMPGWYWCTDSGGIEAWVPNTVLIIEKGYATLNQPYNSIEHTVKPGEIIQYLDETLSWVECLNKEWRYGWVPRDKVEKI